MRTGDRAIRRLAEDLQVRKVGDFAGLSAIVTGARPGSDGPLSNDSHSSERKLESSISPANGLQPAHPYAQLVGQQVRPEIMEVIVQRS